MKTLKNKWFDKFVDENKKFLNFPGVENEELVKSFMNLPLRFYAAFGLEFSEKDDGGCVVIWTVQPDGRYWADEDGFGANNDVEINLYAYADADGNFLSKFKIYNVGAVKFFGTDREEKALRDFEANKAAENSDTPDELLRKLIEKTLEVISNPNDKWPRWAFFDIPEAYPYVAILYIEKWTTQKGTWGLSVNICQKIAGQLDDRVRKTYLSTKLEREEVFEKLRSESINQEIFSAIKRLYKQEMNAQF